MKSLEQMDAEVDEFLNLLAIKRGYESTEKPKVEADCKAMRDENREEYDRCRARYIKQVNRERKDEYDKHRKAYLATGDRSELEHANRVRFIGSKSLEELKQTPIMDILSFYSLKPARTSNNRFKLCCPFHSEKLPSLTIYTDTNSFYCFGCQKGGSVIDFIMAMENCDSREAIKKLSTLYNL